MDNGKEADDTVKGLGEVIRIDELAIRSRLSEVVRDTVEETLNAMLDAEAHGESQAADHKPYSLRT